MKGTLMPPESKPRQELHPAEKADWFEFILDRFSEPASDADKEPHGKIQPMLYTESLLLGLILAKPNRVHARSLTKPRLNPG